VEFCYRVGETEQLVRLEAQVDGTIIAQVGGRVYRVQLQSAQGGQFHFMVDGRRYEAFRARPMQGSQGVSRCYVAVVGSTTPGEPPESRHYEFIPVVPPQGTGQPIEAGLLRLGARTNPAVARSRARGSLDAHMPGQVVQVMVNEGEQVSAGQPLLVLEAMKIVTRVVAPVAGRISRVLVQEGDTVERGQRLVDVEPVA
jgi:biotin carboxyl carrier protein